MSLAEHPVESPPDLAALIDSESLYEVIDGQVVEKPAMGAFESELAFLLATWMSEFVNPRHLGRAVVEAMFNLAPAVNRQRRPDAAFVSTERWPLEQRAPRVAAWPIVPDLAIEVVSPNDLAVEVIAKTIEYFAAGVRRVWVIYPGSEQVYDYASPTAVTILSRADRLEGGDVLPGFTVDLAAYFGEPEPQP